MTRFYTIIIFVFLVGCSINAIESHEEGKGNIKESPAEWTGKASPALIVNSPEEENYIFRLGSNGKVAFLETAPAKTNAPQRYFWLLWLDEKQIGSNVSIKIVGQKMLSTQRHTFYESMVSNLITQFGADHHFSSTITFNEKGLWKLSVSINEKPYGDVFIEVSDE